MTENRCHSCTMPIDNGTYCKYCSDEAGNLVPFDEALERFIRFAMAKDESLDRDTARTNTLQFMSQRLAWKDRPELQELL